MAARFRMLFLCLLGFAPPALATSWRVEGNLLPAETVDRLAERHPDLSNADDLTELLRDIGRRRPMTELGARFENGVWVIYGKQAVLIDDIQIEMTTRLLRTPVQAAVQNNVGTVDSPETRKKTRELVLAYLKRRGYPAADAKLIATPSEGGVAYQIKVSENDPCVIQRIQLAFKLPPGVRLSVAPGDICDMEEIQAAVSDLELDLRDRGYNQLRLELADLVFDMEQDTATVYITGLLGQRVRYEIVDASRRFLIDDLFADDELTNVDPTIVGPDAMAAELARRYRNRGFLDVTIKGPEVSKAGEDEFVYVFQVDPGKQYLLKGVQFEGVTAFQEEELLDVMGLKSIWQTSQPVNYEEIQTGIAALRVLYQQAGYWDAQIRDPGTGQKDKEAASVRFTIQVQEGLRRVLREVVLHGTMAIPETELRKLLQSKVGEPLDRAKLVDFQQAVRTAYIGRGYLYADAQVDLRAEEVKRDLQIDVILTVTEGPRVKIGDVTVSGLTRTKEKVVRRELLIARGEWYDPELINRSRLALTRLGLFRSVNIAPVDRNALAEKSKEIDLVVEVQEGRAGSVSFGPGWRLLQGWEYEAEASYANIGGVGRKASVRGQISEERHQEAIGNKTLVGRRFGTGYTEPYILDLPIDMAIKAGQKAEWGGTLWELSYGGEIEFIHVLRSLIPGARVSTFYGQEIEKTEGPKDQEDALAATDVRVGSVGVRYQMDERDNIKFPTDGYTFDVELAWAEYELGGDLRYFRWDTGSSVYFGILDDLVFAVGLNLTSYESVERKGDQIGVLPATKRLYSGGTETVRGYPSRSLGPILRRPILTDNEADQRCDVTYEKDEFRGSSRTTIKTELRYRLTESFALAGFVDNGNVFLSKEQMAKFQQYYENNPVESADPDDRCAGLGQQNRVQENYSYEYSDLLTKPGYIWSRHYFSYGAALGWLTPLGSLNIAYGLPWREPRDDECSSDTDRCTPRAKQGGHWLTRGELHLNVGARF